MSSCLLRHRRLCQQEQDEEVNETAFLSTAPIYQEGAAAPENAGVLADMADALVLHMVCNTVVVVVREDREDMVDMVDVVDIGQDVYWHVAADMEMDGTACPARAAVLPEMHL